MSEATSAASFLPTLAAAHARIAAIHPADYARSRNAVDGAVTKLSPYITHGFVTLPEVLRGAAARHHFGVQHKFVFELGWREFFRHVWQHRGDRIFASLHTGPLPDDAYAPELPADIRAARTGVPVIDAAVRTLYATGYLHNHARMWVASYVVHLRRVHWRAGADWLYAHLLDGDLASNHLSWQWVAGTGSHKPYLFNADNVARYAPADWHSPGSAIDTSYDALEAIARGGPLPSRRAGADGVDEPARLEGPPAAWPASAPDAAEVAGRDVWLVHPWSLREAPADLPPNTLRLGLWPAAFHRRWPWSAARWAFAGTRLAELAPRCWHADTPTIARALHSARSVQMQADPHVEPALHALAVSRPAPRLFIEVDRPCASFSQWWKLATRDAQQLHELPGAASLPAGPRFEFDTDQSHSSTETPS